VPMSVAKAATYQEVGTVSWYGNETLRQKDGHMTANGEAFDPGKPTAALTCRCQSIAPGFPRVKCRLVYSSPRSANTSFNTLNAVLAAGTPP